MQVTPYLEQFMSDADAITICRVFLERCVEEMREKAGEELEDNEGEDLCNCEFSLAYGGKILLNNTRRVRSQQRTGCSSCIASQQAHTDTLRLVHPACRQVVAGTLLSGGQFGSSGTPWHATSHFGRR